jgi:hypothetical protein
MGIVNRQSENVYRLYEDIFFQVYGQKIIIERPKPQEDREVEHGKLADPKNIEKRKKFLGLF